MKNCISIPFAFLLLLWSGITFAQNNLSSEKEQVTGPKGSLSISEDPGITRLMQRYSDANQHRKGMPGYRIQIYSGSGSQARREALKTEADFLKIFPEVETAVIFTEPYFKTRVGNFRTKYEGYKVYKSVSKYFPGCYFVIEPEMSYPKI
jgi:hypothetical protein